MGRARTAAPGTTNEPALRTGGGGGTGAPVTAGPDPAAAELYLLATDRPTGQPPPPEGALGPAGPQRAERPGRMAVGLSGA
jgi:hypothetical protein